MRIGLALLCILASAIIAESNGPKPIESSIPDSLQGDARRSRDSSISEMDPYVIRRELAQPEWIQGYHCKSWISYYSNGRLSNFFTAEDVKINNIDIPKESRVFLRPDGSLTSCWFSKDVLIDSIPCSGGNAKTSTGFHPNGKLRGVFLRKPMTIQGFPCRNGGLSATVFYESGRLKQCELNEDISHQGILYKKRTVVFLDQNGMILKTKRDGTFHRVTFDILYGLVKIFFPSA